MIYKYWNLYGYFSDAEQPTRRKQEYDLKEVYVNQAAETSQNYSNGKNIQNK